MMAGFDPVVLHLRELDWRSLSADLIRFERAMQASDEDMHNRSVYLDILRLIKSGSVEALRNQVAERIEPDGSWPHGKEGEKIGLWRPMLAVSC